MKLSELSNEEILSELKKRVNYNSYQNEVEKLKNEVFVLAKQLREAEESKSNFLSNIKNELVNPVTAIIELSKHVLENKDKASVVEKFTNLIIYDSSSLGFQLKNIILAAEIESGLLEIYPSRCDVHKIVLSVFDQFRYIAIKKNVSFELIKSSEEDVNFLTDPEKLHFIIANLISNAFYYSQNDAIVKVFIRFEKDALAFSVFDTGEGISDDQQETIFHRFKQAESGSAKKYPGSGLGLCVTKSLCELLNGTISFATDDVQGTSFSVNIPKLSESEYPDQAQTEEGNDFFFSNEDSMVF